MKESVHYCRGATCPMLLGTALARRFVSTRKEPEQTMRYSTTIAGQVFTFDDLKQVMAVASPARSGDYLAGIGAATAQQRMAARHVLADTPLKQFLTEALIPYESDNITRLIIDSHDAAAF